MVWSLATAKRRRRLAEDAEKSRASAARRMTAWLLIIAYNFIGVADITSTIVALETGAGAEANPFVASMMNHAGDQWIYGKLALQGVISFMVAWFPHWIVLGFFTLATLGNMWIVYNNFAIAGMF